MIALLAFELLTVGCSKVQQPPSPAAPASEPATAAAPSAGATNTTNQLPDFTALVDRYGPAVVNVSVVEKAPADQPVANIPENDPFFQFFRRFGVPVPRTQPHPQLQRGLGSGFIISSDGYILTNAHVAGDAADVTVRLTDRREYPAKVVGSDRRSDVAVLKIDARNLPVVHFGDASRLKPGQWVVAIGEPFGFENSVTVGVVSATARSLPGEEGFVPLIQTDVPLNPGNSGGPLFNMNGEVVGINSQIYTQTGGYMGLSFAIPIDVVKDVEEQLVKNGHVRRGRIGVAIQDVNAQLAQSFGLDRPRGALVSSVEKGGPGDKAGLKAGDVIVAVNGQPVDREYQLPLMVSKIQPGKNATLTVWRDRGTRDLTVTVDELKDPQARSNTPGKDQSGGKLGLAVRPLTPQEKAEANTNGRLLVEDANGAAANAGIQPGDVIIAVNGQEVATVEQLRAAVDKAGKTVALLIQRDQAQIFVPVPTG
jgi:serine protease Do